MWIIDSIQIIRASIVPRIQAASTQSKEIKPKTTIKPKTAYIAKTSRVKNPHLSLIHT